MAEDEERAAEELWRTAQQAVRTAFARPTEACPDVMKLLRYALSLAGQQGIGGLPEELKAIGRHKAFCGYCARRYRLLRAALAPTATAGVQVWLLRRPLIRATDSAGRRLLRELGEWIAQMIDKGLKPLAASVTLGPVRTRGAIAARGERQPEVQAPLLDRDGRSLGESTVLRVEQGPEIRNGRFRLTLKTSEPRYEGYEACVALKLEEGEGAGAGVQLELGRASVHKGTVTVDTKVGELGLNFEPVIPLHLLVVTLQPR